MSFTMTQQTIQKHWTLIQESASVMLRKKAGQIALQFSALWPISWLPYIYRKIKQVSTMQERVPMCKMEQRSSQKNHYFSQVQKSFLIYQSAQYQTHLHHQIYKGTTQMIPYLQLVVLNILFFFGGWLFFNIKKQLTELHTIF